MLSGMRTGRLLLFIDPIKPRQAGVIWNPDSAMETLGSNPVEAGLELPPPMRTRRRRVRQKVHTPAYASLNGSSSGQILDLSEIVDISEGGMAIQTSSPLQVQRSVNLCLDLTATRACIHTTGEVVWSDESGRVGIRFPLMPDEALRQLKEWLFVNVMVACVNHRADLLSGDRLSGDRLSGDRLSGDPLSASQLWPNRLPQVAFQDAIEKPTENSALANWMRQELEPTAPADYTSILTALAAVKREVDSLGSDLDGALQLLAERALTFTRATGAAIALTDGASMICRASAGQDAPGLGARFSIGSGFSGECVRTGELLRCDDSETDPVVDRESCRGLGIRSMIAVPIRWDDAVIGLLEVFSPEPYAFNTNDPLALKRLAGICGAAVHRAGTPEADSAEGESDKQNSHERKAVESGSHQVSTLSVDDEFPVETPADLPLPRFSRSRKILLWATAATVLFAGSWLISPRDFARSSSVATSPPATVVPSNTSAPVPALAGGVESIRKLAEQGDATAQFSMGARYATGEDVPQDYSEAVRWFSMAAQQGHVVSQATLGAYYWAGRGVPPDLVKAYFWSVLAQAGGDEASKYRVSALASRMTHAQVAAAQQQANYWIKEHQTVSQNSSSPQ
jgi:putative methionine-R-sulfoxide reductase with GAF domain